MRDHLEDEEGVKPALYQEAMQDHLPDEPGLALPEPVTLACPNCPFTFNVMPNLRPTHVCRCPSCGYSSARANFRSTSF